MASASLSSCDCFAPLIKHCRWPALRIHDQPQDTNCDAWKQLLDLIDEHADAGDLIFTPGHTLGPERWRQVITLPASIAKLKQVKILNLFGSHLLRIPPAIGEMAALEEIDLYTSYGLHYLPYEITQCARLKESRFSTRALYGNHKYRPPFPQLPQNQVADITPSRCSVCNDRFGPTGPYQRWISLRVAKDVLPLLVHACSDGCIARLPIGAEGYLAYSDTGGTSIRQPPPTG